MKLLFGILIVCSFLGVFAESDHEVKKTRDGKVFSLFSIVTFQNQGCRSQSGTVTSGGNRNGTCYTMSECSQKEGKASGTCAAGFGVCCLFVFDSASTSVAENCSYIQNPNFPQAYGSTSTISWTVKKCTPQICSLRLDFETFTTAGPTLTNDNNGCPDTFAVTASPSNEVTPTICGENAGQHIYVDIGMDTGATAKLEFTFSTTVTTVSRSWEIKVTQIECSSLARPYDAGCLQYFTGTTGRLTSFNFAQSSSSDYGHLPSQNQNICIRQESGYCCITYNVCSDTNSWAFDNIAATSLVNTECTTDFIEITGITYTCETQELNTRLCGSVFQIVKGATVANGNAHSLCDCTRPFQVQFVTNGVAADTTTTTNPQRGFCIEYKQQSCNNQ